MRAWIIFSLMFMSQALWAQQSSKKPTPPPQPPITPDRVYEVAPPAPVAGAIPPAASPVAPQNPADVTAPAVQAENSPVPPPVDVPVNSFKAAPIRGTMISPGLTYYSRQISEASSQVGEVTTLVIDMKAGYVFKTGALEGLFVGGQGLYETGKANNRDAKGYHVGPSVGYSDSYTGFFVSATYHLFGKMDLSGGTYDKVRGLEIDLAYPLAITDTVRFGPQVSWKNLKYTDGGALSDTDMKGFSPFATLWINF
jgi:hypothetical protein